MSKYPHFTEALRGLGNTNDECAQRLGVSRTSFYLYLRGEMLPPVEKVKRFPTLDNALTLDIRGEAHECSCTQVPT